MKIPFKYTYRSIKTRKTTAFITITGIALVVFVFTAALMMAYGIEETLVATGSPDNVKIVRKSAQGEISSIVDGDTQGIISTLPHIKKGRDGRQLISNEPVVVINLNIKTGGMSNITVRGVNQSAYEIRPLVKMIRGRLFNPSLRELIAGKSVNNKFEGAEIGSTVNFAGDNWTVVGIFEADGSGFESEMWGDSQQLLQAFNRDNAVSSVVLKLDDSESFEAFRKAFESEQRLNQFEPKVEQKYYEEQSEFLAGFIRILGIFITVIFSFGATIGAMITMYSSVANRTVEIGTMRSLGFSRRNILGAFLIEALCIAVLGGVIGLLLASILQFFSLSTLNWNSWSELQFSFALSTDIIIYSLIFAVIMGFIGGFLPSLRAARLNIVSALRAG